VALALFAAACTNGSSGSKGGAGCQGTSLVCQGASGDWSMSGGHMGGTGGGRHGGGGRK